MSWAEEFKRLRNLAKMTQAEAAEMLGYSKRAIETWEAGLKEPREFVQSAIRARLYDAIESRK